MKVRRLPGYKVCLSWLFCAAVSICVASPALAAGTEDSRRKVEAAFLYNFVKFIGWPGAAADDSEREINICLLGDDVLGEVLEEIVKAGSLKGVRVLRGKNAGPSNCHIAFLEVSAEAERRAILTAFAKSSTVTVSEQMSFLDEGGSIQFFTEEGRVRFSVRTVGMAAKGVTISSRMLSLAAKVVSE